MCVFWRRLPAFVAPPEGESTEDTWDSEGNEKSLMYIFAPEDVNPIDAWFRTDSLLPDATCERHSPHLQSVEVRFCHIPLKWEGTQYCLLFNDLKLSCQSEHYHSHSLM